MREVFSPPKTPCKELGRKKSVEKGLRPFWEKSSLVLY
jgi:hypothetical protein